ncbi:hypothetical protein FIBSPDRAFT_881422 [Athelia psychrophila]|uniref:Uncharacterized protein n=1 Tax=Athelia psychrophila TaxID=1759441 RepID=A0A166WNF0_9AGAM|nr:hypothetical protein FIBSPDRAFT_881422 [Fibularhizoctonia sp. CBS 109695]
MLGKKKSTRTHANALAKPWYMNQNPPLVVWPAHIQREQYSGRNILDGGPNSITMLAKAFPQWAETCKAGLSRTRVEHMPWAIVTSAVHVLLCFTLNRLVRMLYFKHASGGSLVLVVTHEHSLKAQLDVWQAKMQIAFQEELYAVDTVSDVLFKLLALHFTWYNKFSERGAGASEDIHPNQLPQDGALKVNWGQRGPRESQDILKGGEICQVFRIFIFWQSQLWNALDQDVVITVV